MSRRLDERRLPARAKRMPLLFAALCVTPGKLTLLPDPNPIYFPAFYWPGYTIAARPAELDLFKQLRERPALVRAAAVVLMSALRAARIQYLPGFGPFAIIAVATYLRTLVIYEISVRRFNPIRFVFGPGPKKA